MDYSLIERTGNTNSQYAADFVDRGRRIDEVKYVSVHLIAHIREALALQISRGFCDLHEDIKNKMAPVRKVTGNIDEGGERD
jgi:hypothetical protein